MPQNLKLLNLSEYLRNVGLNGNYLLSPTDHAGTRLWNLNSREKLQCFSGFRGWTYAVAFGSQLYTCNTVGLLKIWDL
jgi:WD40 repeat protein